MTELEINCGYKWLAEWLDKHVSPRQYYLHNRIGGQGWEVYWDRYSKGYYTTILKVVDPSIATFVMLSIQK